ncbi:hypothetical protein RhiirA5_461716 [Rhizophagus irregularis]|uniref:Uncharacterized protein n=2 Tax=Rhizophagus irregularis TaxID=588596 RepID=A0A2I1EN22_9GLOM|nr:hypothetical protein GLOIN_2v1485001 [Rhizophagus irregularis DAOM 181602=DAOM 197198]PKC12925.1 hypothetical protein RhiirA5_461716 [Rhizophagus irregularis]PKY23527.1 hypothetical protein RhiirB3_387291 [Rhizophagus irregularis]POG63044.1 hypothetical protein GLOIN_2v1485001 [Rhizophagus irregularis DAOM 181602=DAOM 197198]|eukprot:XP_025169910.1 hypothetical protein GLOIN_2v1485001 [Rhizophagus irregularis DAOM 181602=DAOM 197198]
MKKKKKTDINKVTKYKLLQVQIFFKDNDENKSDNENKSNDALLQSESKVSNDVVDIRQFQEFQKNYLVMCNDIKWKLPSGSYVEEDQEYIKTYNAMADPELEDGLMEYLVTFNETDISKMRDKINAEIDMTPYDPKKHFDYQYVYQVFANLGEGCSLASSERKIKQEKVQKQGLKLAGSVMEFRDYINRRICYVEDLIFLIHEVLVAKLRIKQNIELSNKKCNNLKEALRNKQSKRSRSDNDLPDNQTSPRKKSSYIILAFN